MSSSNNESMMSSTNDSSVMSSSDHLQTPPKQTHYNGILPAQQQPPSSSAAANVANSSVLFFSDEISGTGTPILVTKQSQPPAQPQPSQIPATAPPFTVDTSILRTETPDLEIDFALGDLNLDDYNDFLSQKKADSGLAENGSARVNGSDQNRSLLDLGSLTPNAAAVARFPNPSTPTWSSVVPVPQTAPPFNNASLNNSSAMLDRIKSFKLPEYDADAETTTSSSDNTQNNNSSGSTSAAPGAPGPHQFGGSLLVSQDENQAQAAHKRGNPLEQSDSSQGFQMFSAQQFQNPYAAPDMYANFHSHRQFPSFGLGEQGAAHQPLWNGSLDDYNQYMAASGNFGSVPPAQARGFQQAIPQIPAQQAQQASQSGPLSQQQQPQQFYRGHHTQQSFSSQMPANQQQQQQRPQQPQQQQQRWNNSGVNVHRSKMNNHNGSRRKGEDPSKYANAKLEDFKTEIYSLCKDQHGCRFLQKQLDANDEIKTTLIFNETYLHVVELMVDPFGNYLIQKLLEKCNNQQRVVLVKNASPEFYKISVNPHGTRALQKLIESVTTEEESLVIVESLKPHIVTLSRDLNGNHVVQKCLSKLGQKYTQFIFDISCECCVEIAKHRHGCCVLQRCLDYGSFEQCRQLGAVLSANVLELSFDPFGNYVVQYILNNSELIDSKDECITVILVKINSAFIDLSLHKFGSNVIEKILRLPKINKPLVDLILNKLTIKDFNRLLNDSYGNYVLQTCLDVSNFENFEKLKTILIPILPTVKNTPHGRRISARLGMNLNNLGTGTGKDSGMLPVNSIAKVEG